MKFKNPGIIITLDKERINRTWAWGGYKWICKTAFVSQRIKICIIYSSEWWVNEYLLSYLLCFKCFKIYTYILKRRKWTYNIQAENYLGDHLIQSVSFIKKELRKDVRIRTQNKYYCKLLPF